MSRVVFPEPVLPMMAVVSPAATRNEMLHSTGCSAPGYSKATSRSSSELSRPSSVIGFGGAAIDGSAPSTSWIRSALTDARGAMTATKVASITDMRIWMR